ncbi:Uncharacterised protein [Bartonella vinsonii]|uniref:Uncharacterized protein n=1 Tax=Bartonella vinsonii TaxID=33047 RepID=A0A448V569_BARVI|nr:Uncharacterised protein [Bartonella vinsonii]
MHAILFLKTLDFDQKNKKTQDHDFSIDMM